MQDLDPASRFLDVVRRPGTSNNRNRHLSLSHLLTWTGRGAVLQPASRGRSSCFAVSLCEVLVGTGSACPQQEVRSSVPTNGHRDENFTGSCVESCRRSPVKWSVDSGPHLSKTIK